MLGLLGAGALATGAVATAKYLTRKDPKSEMGKIKLKLPGSRKDPNTAAEVELPIDMPGMSPTLIEGLNRGVRLQARKNVRANSFKRDPQTGKLVPYEEWKAQQVQKEQQPDNVIEFSKAASSSPGFADYSCIKARIDFCLLFRKYMEPCFAFGSTNAFPVVLFRHVGSRVSKPHGYPGYVICSRGLH